MLGFRNRPKFDVHLDDPARTLVCGFAEFGLAGLTAIDYLVEQLELEQSGHIEVEQLPAITPFANGTPRHHTRLFSKPDLDFTILGGELPVPPFAAEPFGDAIISYAEERDVEEVIVLSGVPIAHGPDEHRAFFVASEDYQNVRNPAEQGIEGMSGGFLDGVNGALMSRAIDSPLRAAVYTTPVHAQIPDVEAALRLLKALTTVYEIDIDTEPLETFAAEVSRHYEELAARMEAQETEMPHDDRMYM